MFSCVVLFDWSIYKITTLKEVEEEDENADDVNQVEEEEEVDINEICQQLCEGAVKCEQKHGF